ncbi:MAG: phage portal protein [Deltaproteobacteria bacterium]|nr:phage portal protein [Deltaproteobacteria bacterium]
MTKEELEKTHPDYKAWIPEWSFFIRAYFGGKLYRDGNYLIQHPFESSANYGRRKEIACYYNYCAPIVDIYVSHLFRKPAKKDYGSLKTNPLFNSFLRDSDLEGSSFGQFMRDSQRFASIYGRVSIVMDKPLLKASTLAEAAENDIRPYVSLVTPENLLDWKFQRSVYGKPVLGMVKIREAENIYRIWTGEGWELWEALADSAEARLLNAGVHGLGVVPLVTLYNRRSGIRMLGTSDIQDIADINKNIYYLCSDAKEIIENTAFPMLAVPYEKTGVDQGKEVGPRNILQFDPSEAGARPYWLEAPHSSLTEIREWVKQDIGEIFRIAKMGGAKAAEDFSQPRSGIALELEYQQLHAVLAEKADNMEQAESELLNLWAGWEGGRFDGTIDYPDDFSVRELDRNLEAAFKALEAKIESATFRKELQKEIASTILPKLDDSKKEEISREIDGRKG